MFKPLYILVLICISILSLAGYGFYAMHKTALVGTGYHAKTMCSLVFNTGRSVESVLAEELRDYGFIQVKVDHERRLVDSSVGRHFKRRALYREGAGCVLVLGKSEEELRNRELPAAPEPHSRKPGPRVSLNGVQVEAKNVNVRAFLKETLEKHEAPGAKINRTRAIVVLRKGEIVAEGYGSGYSQDSIFSGYSLSKSLINVLAGILSGKELLTPDEKMLIPEWSAPGDSRAEITLENLLHMNSGLQFSEGYGGAPKDVALMLFARDDAASFAAEKFRRYAPGSKFQYSSGSSNILARYFQDILKKQGLDPLNFPRQEIFEPLGMDTAFLEMDGIGTFLASTSMYASARDWARLGQLYLQKGVWNGRQILPAGWVDFSVQPGPGSDGRYGAHLWLNATRKTGPKERWMPELPGDIFSAIGHMGQFITIIPSEELVVVRLGFTHEHQKHWNHQSFLKQLIEQL